MVHVTNLQLHPKILGLLCCWFCCVLWYGLNLFLDERSRNAGSQKGAVGASKLSTVFFW